MKKISFNRYGFVFSALLITVIICGCQTVYDTLPYMPEYPEPTREFDTSAIIEYYPVDNKAVDGIFINKLAECQYKNVIKGTHYLKTPPESVKILDVISSKHTVYNCENGKYLDTRVLVMVRNPGVIWENRLRYSEPRYFQAFSQTVINSEEKAVIDEIYLNNVVKAVDNLFRIAEFRQALEPQVKSSFAGTFANKADEYWAKSKYYQTGENENLFEAARFALMAAEDGNVEAAKYFADNALYTTVFGKTSDFLRFVENMAAAGNASAQNRLGLLFLNGEIVQQNHLLAFYWFKKAADSGLPVAIFNVGYCYEYGKGIEKNLAEAFLWYRKAADKGFGAAIVKLRTYKKL